MASRYLLIEFDDEAAASRLRAQIDNASRAGKAFRVVGLFAQPRNYCKCDPHKQTNTKSNKSPLKRGKRFGWWVCTECKRPTSSLAGLVNLIKPRDIINPPKWRAKTYPLYTTEAEFMQHIPSISGTALGPPGVEYWNER